MKTKLELVTEQTRLESYCRDWRAAGRFAFDTEFIRDDTYEAQLCLIQVSTDHQEVVLIDPTARLDLAPFWNLVTDESVQTVVHAGKEDFEVCLRAVGHPPRNVFDVQIAAGFVGYGYPLSLARLVNAALHQRIAKGQTLTNWLKRPLTDEQLRYAIEDVKYLPAIHDNLQRLLAETGRENWAREEFAQLENPDSYSRPVQQRIFKLKGSKKLDGVGLAVLSRLVEWRDHWAQEKNRPPRALIRDDILVSIAKRRPTSARELEVLRGFPQARKSSVVNEMLQIIREASATPRDQCPDAFVPREESPMIKVAMNILTALLRSICHEENVGHDLVGSTQRLHELIDYQLGECERKPLLLTGWREQFIGRRLVELLEGRSELRLSGWPRHLRLDVVNHPAAKAASRS